TPPATPAPVLSAPCANPTVVSAGGVSYTGGGAAGYTLAYGPDGPADVQAGPPPGSRARTGGMGSLGHLVRAQGQITRDRPTQRVRGLPVEHQLELRGLLDRQIRRPRALQDLVHERRRLPMELGDVLTVAHQAAGDRVLAIDADRRQ